jgi:hypothetical protein
MFFVCWGVGGAEALGWRGVSIMFSKVGRSPSISLVKKKAEVGR